MSRFGWAYVNDVITGSGGSTTPGGSDKAIQFASGSTFSGSTNFTFDYNTNTVRLTGTLYADNLIVSSSQILKSGSTIFGDDLLDTHQFTGSVYVTGVVSSSTGIQSAGAITSQGIISSSLGFQTNTTVEAAGNITSQAIISSSNGFQTNSTIDAVGNIRTTNGDLSSSIGIQTGGFLTVAGATNLKSGLTVTGSSFVQALSSSGQIQATSFAGNGLNIIGVQATNVDGAGDDWAVQFKSGDTGTLTGSSNLLFSGSTLTLTGSFLMTGSSTFVNIGPTILSGTLNVTGAITGNNAFISGGLSVGNYVQMLPVGNVIIPTNQTASYIYTSGSTNDLYFTQYQPGTSFTNTTRLRWLEGGLSSGLLHGGILSTVTGTTSFNLSAGSGLIVTYNASTGSDPYPTITQVTWENFVSQSLIYSSSAQITYVSIDNFGQIDQTNVAFTPAQFKDRIIIGRVIHQSGAVTNGVITTPSTAYGINSNTQDFFRAFGPLKVSGQVLAASGTTTLAITRSAGDSYVEGRNYSTNPDSPNYVLAADDAALTTTKIFYSWVSGSTVNIDTNGGPGYTALIPDRYNLNGTVTTITPTNNKYTIQRVYWFPKSVTRSLYVYYGSTIYTSLADAVAAIANEPNFTEGDNTKGSAVYLGAVVMEAGISNFTDTTKSQIVNGGLFRATSNGGGGGGGTTSPGGSNHEIQFNDSGVFNGSPNLTFDTTTLRLTGSFAMIGTGSLDIDGGFITGSGRASFGIVSGSTVTGSTALFTTITGSALRSTNVTIISGSLSTGATVVSHTIPSNAENFTVSNEYNDKLITVESNATKDIVKIGPASSTAGLTTEIYIQGNPGDALLEVSPTTTFLSNLSGTTAQFTSITGSTALLTSGAIVTGSVYVNNGSVVARGLPSLESFMPKRSIQLFPLNNLMCSTMFNATANTPFREDFGSRAHNFDSNGRVFMTYTSSATANSTSGITTTDIGSTKVLCRSIANPNWRGFFKTGGDLTLQRIFVGFEPYSASSRSADDPNSGYAFLQYSSVRGDTEFKIISKTQAGGTQVTASTGINVTANTNYFFDMVLASGSFTVTLTSGSTTTTTSLTSSLLNQTASLGTCAVVMPSTTSVRDISIYMLEFNDT
jgi:hypothetical protein